jgi:hypothetical protein
MRRPDAPDFYRPIAAPLDRCAELLGVDLAPSAPGVPQSAILDQQQPAR